MTNESNEPNHNLPVFRIEDGELVRIKNDICDPKRRYTQVVGPDGVYLREYTDEEERQRDEEEARWKAEAPQRALQAEQQKEEATKFQGSLKYDVRLVAFIDILGWKKAIEARPQQQEDIQKLGLALNTIRSQLKKTEWMAKNAGTGEWPGDPQITQFSDCLAISTRVDFAGKSHLVSTLGFLSTSLLHQGFLLRGGITCGQLYHKESIVYGPALLKAHELENRCAIYPRIILDPTLSKLWGQGEAYLEKDGTLIGYARTWRLSHDGFRFFDFLQPFEGIPSFWESPHLIKHSLLPLRSLLNENLETHKNDSSVLPKYIWLANYFNDVCKEYVGHGVEPIEIPV